MNCENTLSAATRMSLRSATFTMALMLTASITAWALTPRFERMPTAPDLDATVPKKFGEWRVISDASSQVGVSQGLETSQEQPYDQTVMRTYANSQGEQIMLALAWGERQRQDIKVHRPEVCYSAYGYTISRKYAGNSISTGSKTTEIPSIALLAKEQGQYEVIRYWIRIGNQYGGDGLATRWYILKEGLAGKIPDGILVRASQIISQPEAEINSQALLENFLSELVAATPSETRKLLVQ